MFGATSLVGSHFVANVPAGLTLAAAGRTTPAGRGIGRFDTVDLHDTTAVRRLVATAPEPVVVNFAARTDVDGIERERPGTSDSDPSGSPAFQVNALAPEAMARSAGSVGKNLITISTDFVFDGTRGPYDESQRPDPLGPRVSWYGWTKGEGERRVRAALPSASIIRISYPYRPPFAGKVDFAGWIRQRAKSGALPPMYTDQQITPTWIPDVSAAVARLAREPRGGTYHVASPTVCSPHSFATELLAQDTGVRPQLAEGSLERRLKEFGVTPRPLRGGLVTGNPPKIGFVSTPWEEGLSSLVGTTGAT